MVTSWAPGTPQQLQRSRGGTWMAILIVVVVHGLHVTLSAIPGRTSPLGRRGGIHWWCKQLIAVVGELSDLNYH